MKINIFWSATASDLLKIDEKGRAHIAARPKFIGTKKDGGLFYSSEFELISFLI